MSNTELAKNNIKRALETSGETGNTYALLALTYAMLAQQESLDQLVTDLASASISLTNSIAMHAEAIGRSAAYR